MLPKKRLLTKWSHVVRQSSRFTSSITSDKVREVIYLECWLDKARVEITTWAAVGSVGQLSLNIEIS